MHNKYLAYTCMCLTHGVVNRTKYDLVTIQAERLDKVNSRMSVQHYNISLSRRIKLFELVDKSYA